MRHTRFLAVGISLLSAVVASGQAVAPPGPLPEALRAHLKGERLGVVTSIRGLPLGVREMLQSLFGTRSLDIAEPGAEFQAAGVAARPDLPTRRLVTAGCAVDHCLVYYERGGTARSWQVALFHWTPAETRVEWAATAPGGLATIDEVRAAVLSGSISAAIRGW